MKRGRPSTRGSTTKQIIDVLERSPAPLSASAICKTIESGANRKLSWNTVQKYIDELVTIGKVEPIELPHSKDESKKGMTVYKIKST